VTTVIREKVIRYLLSKEGNGLFDEFIRGQTVGVDPETGDSMIYYYDFERWLGRYYEELKDD